MSTDSQLRAQLVDLDHTVIELFELRHLLSARCVRVALTALRERRQALQSLREALTSASFRQSVKG